RTSLLHFTLSQEGRIGALIWLSRKPNPPSGGRCKFVPSSAGSHVHSFSFNESVYVAIEIVKHSLDAIRFCGWCLIETYSSAFESLIRSVTVLGFYHARSILAHQVRKPRGQHQLHLFLLRRRNGQPAHPRP